MTTLVSLGKRALPPTAKARLKDFLQLDRRESYSQFGEDAVLFAYFWGKEWTPGGGRRGRLRRRGFYVDIGAYAPTQDSNTHVFYRSGWRGINIDATPGVMEAFDKVRPRDINLHLAIGNLRTELEFYTWGAPCTYNTSSREIANERIKEVGPPTVVRVPSAPLADVLAAHLPPNQAIDFMSVDVEGMDLSVLESNDWTRYRPELLMVEAHVRDIAAVLADPIHQFAEAQGYRLYAWTPPTLIFKDASARASRSG